MSLQTARDAAATLGAFAGLSGGILKSEDAASEDFAYLPPAVQLAVTTVGAWGQTAPAVEKVEKDMDRDDLMARIEKYAAENAEEEKKWKTPGQGMAAVTDILRDLAKRAMKEHPGWSEAKAMDEVLQTEQGAKWWERGRIIEAEARRPR